MRLTRENSMTVWVIYDHPADYPDVFIARQFLIVGGDVIPTENTISHRDVDEIRQKLLNHGLGLVPRFTHDDPKIVETWM